MLAPVLQLILHGYVPITHLENWDPDITRCLQRDKPET
jgi:hypothetical protein